MARANAVYESQYLLGTSIARPLIAKAQIDMAREFQADTVAHGATGKGNDQCRFELAAGFSSDLKILAPWRDSSFRKGSLADRNDQICRDNKIDVEASASKPYSMGQLMAYFLRSWHPRRSLV